MEAQPGCVSAQGGPTSRQPASLSEPPGRLWLLGLRQRLPSTRRITYCTGRRLTVPTITVTVTVLDSNWSLCQFNVTTVQGTAQ